MRIIFMGSPEFAVPSLDALVEAGHELVAAYCQPPRPAGRGKAERKTAVHERAEGLGIDVRTPASLKSEAEQTQFAALDADLAVVAAYGLILPPPILEAPRGGCINVHASLLPRWRGAAPIQRAILAGDERTGVTIMQMDQGLDTGPMLLQHDLMILGKNAGQVTKELAKLGAEALLEWLADPGPAIPQSREGVTYADKVAKAEARLDFVLPAEQLVRKVRAFNPQPGAYFEFRAKRVKILEAQVVPLGGGDPGQVVDDQLTIQCIDDAIWPAIVQPAGGAPMSTEDFIRGHPISRWDYVDGYPASGYLN